MPETHPPDAEVLAAVGDVALAGLWLWYREEATRL